MDALDFINQNGNTFWSGRGYLPTESVETRKTLQINQNYLEDRVKNYEYNENEASS